MALAILRVRFPGNAWSVCNVKNTRQVLTHVFLVIAANILVWLMTGFVVQGHIWKLISAMELKILAMFYLTILSLFHANTVWEINSEVHECKLRILSYILTFFAACRFASLNCEKINSDTMSELQDRNSQFWRGVLHFWVWNLANLFSWQQQFNRWSLTFIVTEQLFGWTIPLSAHSLSQRKIVNPYLFNSLLPVFFLPDIIGLLQSWEAEHVSFPRSLRGGLKRLSAGRR